MISVQNISKIGTGIALAIQLCILSCRHDPMHDSRASHDSQTSHDIQTPPTDAVGYANEYVRRYTSYESDSTAFAGRKKTAQSLTKRADELFRTFHYAQAWDIYSTAGAWVPSCIDLVKEGDALFWGLATGAECSTYLAQAVKLQVPQTYEAATIFCEFEHRRTGMPFDSSDLERIDHKSICLKDLASRSSSFANSCVPRDLIRECLR